MRLSIKAMTIAGAVVWGVYGIFLTGVLNLLFPPYGGQFLQMMSSVYPGYQVTSGFPGLLLGTVYGLADGAIAGFLLALIYNAAAGKQA